MKSDDDAMVGPDGAPGAPMAQRGHSGAAWAGAGRAPIPPGLHLVATPIGNAGDITLRALDTLARADVLAAEDTRTLRRLMEIHGVALNGRPLIAYNDHNGPRRRPQLLEHLAVGRSVAYCSDAGTPLVSDPGWKLASEAVAAGADITAAPGASAVLAALCVSGLPSDRFLFAGFLPQKAGARRTVLAELAQVPATLVFYEAPRRAAETLRAMAEILGPDRPAAFCRELTKRFEQVRRGSVAELAEALGAEPAAKGEAVLVIGPPDADAGLGDAETVDEQLRAALARGSVKDAARDVAALTGRKRADLYARALELRGEDRS
ncbi:MAG: 16S rRNA (cytidine1402-2'-O)-methyltransferase [Paracoccaceae bacterium]|jgi:16S rRNA (cytidine1402-2'-O)-methyltransferase